jgi:hypothetical protein
VSRAPGAGPAPHRLAFEVLAERLAVVALPLSGPPPGWSEAGPVTALVRTRDERTAVCAEAAVPAAARAERGWRALRLQGPFPFELTGILHSALEPLARAGVSIFAFSTFDTDYVLVKEDRLAPAVAALREAGHTVTDES